MTDDEKMWFDLVSQGKGFIFQCTDGTRGYVSYDGVREMTFLSDLQRLCASTPGNAVKQ